MRIGGGEILRAVRHCMCSTEGLLDSNWHSLWKLEANPGFWLIIEPSCGQQPTAHSQRPTADGQKLQPQSICVHLVKWQAPQTERKIKIERLNESGGRSGWLPKISKKKTKLKVTNRGWHPSNCKTLYMRATKRTLVESARLANTPTCRRLGKQLLLFLLQT